MVALNPAQRAAVEGRGPLLVLAGAGSGKTRVITHRVVRLLDEGVPAWRILAVTFTNRAAAEMRERIDRLAGERHPLRELWVGTFHSICARILRQHGEVLGFSRRFSIYDPDDQLGVIKRTLEELKVPETVLTAKHVAAVLDRAKNRGLSPDTLPQLGLAGEILEPLGRVWRRYQERMVAADAIDFGDLLCHAVTLLGRPESGGQLADLDPVARLRTRFLHVVVDEYQDTNPVQAELVDRLSTRAELCVVGDDDQAIYGWRGADVAQILGFSDRHPGTELVRLEQNYRSPMSVLRCADAIIRKNHGRLGKTLWSELGEGEPVRVLRLPDERHEARLIAREIAVAVEDGISPEDFVVFYRAHAQSRVLEDELRRAALGCRIYGGVAFYERAEVKDLLSYLTILENPGSEAHLLRVINRPPRKIGATTVDRLVARASEAGVPVFKVLAEPESAGLSRGSAAHVRAFHHQLEHLRARMGELSLPELAGEILEITGYRRFLAEDDDEESQARLENLQELLGNMQEFVEQTPEGTLSDYLELVSLAGAESGEGERRESVTLMTVHSAKGLEFEHVYLTGMEEGVFPHARVLEDPVQLEEERRLAYVAVTRAKQTLTVTAVQQRRLYGQVQMNQPSRFVRDLPEEGVVRRGFPGAQSSRSARAAPTPREREPRWNDDIVYDDDASEPTDEGGHSLFVGMRVHHDRFGRGELLGWSGMGDQLRFQLRFPGHGTKTILARFCRME